MSVTVQSGKTITVDSGKGTVTITYGGPKGAKGDTGANGSLAWQDDWASDHGTYYANDFAYHAVTGKGKGLFRCILEHDPSVAATEPVVGGSAATYWETSIQGGEDGEVLMDGTPAEHDIMIRGSLDKHIETSGIQFETTLSADSDLKVPTSEAVAEYVATELTDIQVPINIRGAFISNTSGAANGTLTTSESSVVQKIVRTASTTAHWIRSQPIPLPFRTTASKGYKLKSVTVNYAVASTDTSNDDLEIHILKQVIGADGSAPTAAVLAGDHTDDYDDPHDTKAERLAAATHTVTVTIPTGEQAFMASGEEYSLRIYVADASTANLALTIYQAYATLSEVVI